MIFWYFCKIFIPRSEGPPLRIDNKILDIFAVEEDYIINFNSNVEICL